MCKVIRLLCHSEEIIIEKNKVSIWYDDKREIFELKRLGGIKWITIPTTGNVEIAAEIIVDEQIKENLK